MVATSRIMKYINNWINKLMRIRVIPRDMLPQAIDTDWQIVGVQSHYRLYTSSHCFFVFFLNKNKLIMNFHFHLRYIQFHQYLVFIYTYGAQRISKKYYVVQSCFTATTRSGYILFWLTCQERRWRYDACVKD